MGGFVGPKKAGHGRAASGDGMRNDAFHAADRAVLASRHIGSAVDVAPGEVEQDPPVQPEALRAEVQDKYRHVADNPDGDHHFHTGRVLADRLGYPREVVDALPDPVVESFAGVGNPFSLRALQAGERVVDVGSGAGLDTFLAARRVGPGGAVVGVDMTPAMLDKARSNAGLLGVGNVEFRHGYAEQLPVPEGWADVVMSNGSLNLCADKRAVFVEIHRVLRPGGRLQFADIANGQPVPEAALQDIDLWTG